MFGFYTQIPFSVFKSKISWVPPLNILFGYCFLFLYSNTNTVLLILKSSLLRTTFGCFLFLYLFSFNKIIIFFSCLFLQPLSPSSEFSLFLCPSSLLVGSLMLAVESRWSRWSCVKREPLGCQSLGLRFGDLDGRSGDL